MTKGSFSVLEFPHPADPDFVAVDCPAGNLYLEEPERVRDHESRFPHLQVGASDQQNTVRLIERIAEGFAVDQDFETVIARERRLLDPEVRSDDAAVQALLHRDFREFGSSGTVWDRQSIVQATNDDTAERIIAEDLQPVRLGPDAILLTYTTRRGTATSLRTSVWTRAGNTWLLLHHTGTTVRVDE